jgi:hypothetical protein
MCPGILEPLVVKGQEVSLHFMTLKVKALQFLKTSETPHPLVQHHIPEEKPKPHCCANLKYSFA